MKNPKVDWFFNKPGKWEEAYLEIWEIVLGEMPELAIMTYQHGYLQIPYHGRNADTS